MFEQKTLLITGGTGSFGNAVMDRFMNTGIGEIRIFSRDEKKQDDMRKKYNDSRLKFYLGDVRTYNSIERALEGVDFIFHAAALKQVPSSEFFPMEAANTNVLGTENVLNASIKMGVKKVICLSTDKAVYPINAMGISKALMEKLYVAKSRLTDKTIFIGTRYGNVMASRGSVIPLFIDQIKAGRPLTVTNPDMTRYMMSLENAVELVLFAFENGNSGDLFVQKAPACTIKELALILLEIFEAKNEIQIIGTRHGEKLYESLLTDEECLVAEDLGDYYRVRPDDRDLNYSKYFSEGTHRKSDLLTYNSHNAKRLNHTELKKMLLDLHFIKEHLNHLYE
ncbi:MAG: polysaccharide biosynthesis protein [Ignavibacteriae bacterium]|nr:polysaccharide biosynthesis protein [Ignavibacteriota bacterium]